MSHIGTYKMLNMNPDKVHKGLMQIAFTSACKEVGLEYNAQTNVIMTPSGHDWKVNLATMSIKGDIFWDGQQYNELKAKIPEWYYCLSVMAFEQKQGNKAEIKRVKGELLVFAE